MSQQNMILSLSEFLCPAFSCLVYCFHPFLELLEIINECKRILNNVTSLNGAKPYEQVHFRGTDIVESDPKSSNLPFLSLFCFRSNFSNEIFSPEVNHRKVYPSWYTESGPYKSSFWHGITEENNYSVIATRNLSIFPFEVVVKSEQGPDSEQDMLSVTTTTFEHVDGCSFALDNLAAVAYSHQCYARTCVLLNVLENTTCFNPHFVDVEHLFVGPAHTMNTIDSVRRFVLDCSLPKTLLWDNISYWAAMRRLQQFFIMCGSLSLSVPEGQHRMEALNRLAYHLRIDGSLPLNYPKSDRDDAKSNPEQDKIEKREVPSTSPLFSKLSVNIVQISQDALTSSSLMAIKKFSKSKQALANLEMPADWLDCWKDYIASVLDPSLPTMTEPSRIPTFQKLLNFRVMGNDSDFSEWHIQLMELYKQTANFIFTTAPFTSKPFSDRLFKDNSSALNRLMTEVSFTSEATKKNHGLDIPHLWFRQEMEFRKTTLTLS